MKLISAQEARSITDSSYDQLTKIFKKIKKCASRGDYGFDIEHDDDLFFDVNSHEHSELLKLGFNVKFIEFDSDWGSVRYKRVTIDW